MDFPRLVWVEKIVHRVEIHGLSGKNQQQKTVPGAFVFIQSYLLFSYMKEAITMDFLEKSASVNNVSHCELLRHNQDYLLHDLHTLTHTRIYI